MGSATSPEGQDGPCTLPSSCSRWGRLGKHLLLALQPPPLLRQVRERPEPTGPDALGLMELFPGPVPLTLRPVLQSRERSQGSRAAVTLTRSRSQTRTPRSAPFSSARRPLPIPRDRSLQAAPGPVLRRRPHLRRAALSLAEDGRWGGSTPDVGAGSRRPDTASPPLPASPPGPLSPLSLWVPRRPASAPFTCTPPPPPQQTLPPPPPPGRGRGPSVPQILPAPRRKRGENRVESLIPTPLRPWISAADTTPSRARNRLSRPAPRARTALPSAALPLLPAPRVAARSLRSRWRAAHGPRDPPARRAGARDPRRAFRAPASFWACVPL